MASIHTVFESVMDNGITEGKKVRVSVIDKLEYETVRTRLVKLWNTHKENLISIAGEGCDPLLEFSLCGNFVASEHAGYFFLGKPRRKVAKSYSFAVVDGSESTASNPPTDAVNDESISTHTTGTTE
jgi:hypothetical protein